MMTVHLGPRVEDDGRMELDALIDGLGITHARRARGDVRICDITEDSRTALPGSLFVARKGTQIDGSRFAIDACESGAVAVLTQNAQTADVLPDRVSVLVVDDATRTGGMLAERFYGSPSASLVIGAITGTNGKTTAATMLDQILDVALRPKGARCGLIGTVEIDDGRERGRAVLTTPPGIELSRTLATMREHGCVACAMEASSHALDQGRLSALEIDAAGFTGLSGDHLDYHGDMERYASAKARLFEQLGEGAAAVLNVDDAASERMRIACAEGVEQIQVSMESEDAPWGATVHEESVDGLALSLRTPMGAIETKTKFFGRYNAMNLLVASALADRLMSKLGFDDQQRFGALKQAIPMLSLPRGRMQRVDRQDDAVRVFVDFAHTDDALAHALEGARRVTQRNEKLWCVFGCGGDRDRTKRPRMGQAVSERADRVVLTSDNPRSESPDQIADDVLEGLTIEQRAKTTVVLDRGEAIAHAVRNAAAGDVVVIAGKGHETEQIVIDSDGTTQRTHFDDAEHATQSLHQRRHERAGP